MTSAEAGTSPFLAPSLSLSEQYLEEPGYELPGSQDEHFTSRRNYNMSLTVSVVIPTLNEARNLPHVFARLPDGLHEVIVVDGNSVDDTVAIARQFRPDVRIVIQNRSGKGNALACGFAAATGDVIAMVDADGSADPAEIPRFIKVLLDGADFAKGSRFTFGGGSSDITRLRRLGNRMLSGLVNVLYGTKYSDLCYGYNVFWRRHVSVFGLDTETDIPIGSGTRLWGDGFEVETLINIRIAQAGLKVKEVASYEYARIHGVSNLRAPSDGWRVLRTILAERYYHWRGTTKSDTCIPVLPGSPATLAEAAPESISRTP
jgi:glycosyltransferase involved in cell wall biosynthesis